MIDGRGARLRHAEYYCTLLTRVEQLYAQGGAESDLTIGRYLQEWPNARAGQSCAAANVDDGQFAALVQAYVLAAPSLMALQMPVRLRLLWVSDAKRGLQSLLGHDLVDPNTLNVEGLTWLAAGEPRKAIPCFERALEVVARGASNPDALGALAGNLGQAYLRLDLINEAAKFFELQLRVAEDQRLDAQVMSALGGVAATMIELGRLAEAERLLKRRLRLSRRAGNRTSEGNTLNGLGILYTEAGQSKKASLALGKRIALARQFNDWRGLASGLANLARLQLRDGRPAEAVRLLTERLAIAREQGSAVLERRALADLGDALVAAGNKENGIDCYDNAVKCCLAAEDAAGQQRAQASKARALKALGGDSAALFPASDARAIAKGTHDEHRPRLLSLLNDVDG